VINNLVSRRGASPVAPATGSGRVIPARVRPQTSQTYYHRNQQYSIVGLTNAAGTLVKRFTYSAYGTLGIYAANGTVRSSSTYANRYTYTGREWDGDLRLYHFRARWYDPATGGFVSRDPLGYVDGMSLYRGYFGVRGVDPSGTQWWRCPDGSTMWVPPSTSPEIVQSYRERGCTPVGIIDERGKPTPYPTIDGRPAPFPTVSDPVLKEFVDHEFKPDNEGKVVENCGGINFRQSWMNPTRRCCKGNPLGFPDKWYLIETQCCIGGFVVDKSVSELWRRFPNLYPDLDSCVQKCMWNSDGSGLFHGSVIASSSGVGALCGAEIGLKAGGFPGAVVGTAVGGFIGNCVPWFCITERCRQICQSTNCR